MVLIFTLEGENEKNLTILPLNLLFQLNLEDKFDQGR